MRFFDRILLALAAAAYVAAKQVVHSHNDYEQSSPFYTATKLGVPSVEADVFLKDGKLLVAHTSGATDPAKTLDSLYIQPILKGLQDGSLPKPFQLLIDFKTGGTETLPVVLKALEPLRAAGKLTTFTGGTLTKRDVTVVGTGNTPLDGVKALATRDIFFDAPAGDLSASADWAPTLSPLASADFKSVLGWWFWNDLFGMSDSQKSKLAQLVAAAHTRGLVTRFWNTPDGEDVWQAILDSGSDYLNADDLPRAVDYVKAHGK